MAPIEPAPRPLPRRERERYTLQAALAARAGERNDEAETLLRKVQHTTSSPQLRVQAKRCLFELLEEQGRLDEIKFKPAARPAPAAATTEPR